jgi:hypothetical protein
LAEGWWMAWMWAVGEAGGSEQDWGGDRRGLAGLAEGGRWLRLGREGLEEGGRQR